MKPRAKKLIWIAPLALLGMLLFVAAGGAIVMLLWDWLMPTLFGLREITFRQAVGLLALCRILFGGFGLRGGGPGARARRRADERCEEMSAEERERIRRRVGERFGPGPSAGETQRL